MEAKITKNFTLEELCHSNTAVAKGLKNIPDEKQTRNLKALAINLLQPVRDIYGKPMYINSGFRSPEVNKAVGGSPDSQHMKGEAADVASEHPAELVECLKRSGLDFDQCIQYSTFVHLSLKLSGTNRRQYLKGRY